MPDFEKDIELKKLDLVAGEIRAGYYTMVGVYLSILIVLAALITPVVAFASSSNSISWLGLLGLAMIFVGILLYGETSKHKEHVARLDALIKEVENFRSIGTVQGAIRRVRGGQQVSL